MANRKRNSPVGKNKANIAEILRYVLVGGLAVVIDFALYFSMVNLSLLSAAWAKRVSFAGGTVWSFLVNRKFTFRSDVFKVRQPFMFALVYFTGFIINSVVHDVVLFFSSYRPVSFLAAVFCSTVWNYLGQKFIVFRKNSRKNTK